MYMRMYVQNQNVATMLNNSVSFLSYFLKWCWDSAVRIVTRLWTGEVQRCGSVTSRNNRLFAPSKYPHQLGGPLRLFKVYQKLFLVGSGQGMKGASN
jgi:hypothetical protein